MVRKSERGIDRGRDSRTPRGRPRFPSDVHPFPSQTIDFIGCAYDRGSCGTYGLLWFSSIYFRPCLILAVVFLILPCTDNPPQYRLSAPMLHLCCTYAAPMLHYRPQCLAKLTLAYAAPMSRLSAPMLHLVDCLCVFRHATRVRQGCDTRVRHTLGEQQFRDSQQQLRGCDRLSHLLRRGMVLYSGQLIGTGQRHPPLSGEDIAATR